MRYMRSRALYSAQTTVFPRKMLVFRLEALYAAADLVFITPRSAVRSRPPLPIKSVVYSGQQWPLFSYCGDFCVGLLLSLRKGFNCSTQSIISRVCITRRCLHASM